VPDTFRAERAVTSSGHPWVVVNDRFELHVEATAFVSSLRARGLSVNTERAYAGRTALYLTHCSRVGARWGTPGFLVLRGFQDWLISEPLRSKGRGRASKARFRSRATANAVMTAVAEFLRFCVVQGWAPAHTHALLATPRQLRYLPAGFDTGEHGQRTVVVSATFRFTTADPAPQTLTDAQLARLFELVERARDRFLIALLACTGLRIGEALGLRREDMHLLASSRALGCEIDGPHVHVRRRINANRALAKSHRPRAVPVPPDLVGFYVDYQHERDQTLAAARGRGAPVLAGPQLGADLVLVNLFRPPLGRPMSYPAVKDMFNRLTVRAGFAVRPHMFRHTAATGWLRGGTDPDVVQTLLGHASPTSMQPYLHADDAALRAAVESVAAGRTRAGTR
jgi:integrase/recombinase XerD